MHMSWSVYGGQRTASGEIFSSCLLDSGGEHETWVIGLGYKDFSPWSHRRAPPAELYKVEERFVN